ncbi:MAG: TolC family protein [Bacteroidetes bacterium]|nr:TolC family protein [Bacteroidota bacterium]
MSKHPVINFLFFIFLAFSARAQQKQDSILTNATLNQCVQYALIHLPAINQSLIDEKIVNAEIKTRLADWYPQLNLNYTLQHYFQTPVTVINGTPTTTAQKNFSTAYFGVTQNIFNRDVLLASKTANNVRSQVNQFTTENKIFVALNVSKAFYGVLLSQQQIDLVEQDIVRLERSLKDAKNQYKAGIVDKTDYQRAQISLNNALAEKKQYQESLQSRFSVLKLLMGYPQNDSFQLRYDSMQLKNEIFFDTTQEVNFSNRIEYKILQTQKSLLQSNLNYYKWSFIPSISAYGNYNLTFANNNFGKLYSREFPSSYIGLSLDFPIFQGGKRTWQIRSANLQLDRLDYNFTSLRDSIQSEYTQALSTYKSFLSDYYTQQENLELATDVYNTINLQYKAGVKAYLEVIVAESDLRTTQINYLNALYIVLSSKLDVEKALGILNY